MAMIGTPKINDGVRASWTSQDFARTYRRRYEVLFPLEDDENAVLYGCGFSLYQNHPTAFRSFITDIDAELVCAVSCEFPGPYHNQTVNLWYVDISWGPLTIDTYVIGGAMSQPPRASIDPLPKEVPAFKDSNGTLIVNKAGDFFDPPLTIIKNCELIRVRRNEANPDVAAFRAVADKTNLAAWNGYPEKTVKAYPIKLPDPQYDQETGQVYYPIEYQFEYDPDGWKSYVPNSGFREKKSGKLVKIFDDNSQEISTPAMLDNLGAKLPTPVNPADVVFLEFEMIPAIDFTVFNLDGIPPFDTGS